MQEVPLLKTTLSFGGIQITPIQQRSAVARPVPSFKLRHQHAHLSVTLLCLTTLLVLTTPVLQPYDNDPASHSAADFLFPCHPRSKPARQFQRRVALQPKVVTKRVKHRLGAIIPGKKFLHRSLASSAHTTRVDTNPLRWSTPSKLNRLTSDHHHGMLATLPSKAAFAV